MLVAPNNFDLGNKSINKLLSNLDKYIFIVKEIYKQRLCQTLYLFARISLFIIILFLKNNTVSYADQAAKNKTKQT